MRFDPELTKGSIQLLILAVLRDTPLHGYGISKEIQKRSAGEITYGDGSIYPALHALTRKGLITFDWEPAELGPARKSYKLTPDGSADLDRRLKDFDDFVAATRTIIAPRG